MGNKNKTKLMNRKTFTASILALAHLSAAWDVPHKEYWADDCHYAFFNGPWLAIKDRCGQEGDIHLFNIAHLNQWWTGCYFAYFEGDDIQVVKLCHPIKTFTLTNNKCPMNGHVEPD